MAQFVNLVFEGGGIKSIAYVGAIGVLKEKKIMRDIRRVAGTSAGAIVATLLALGAGAAQIQEILHATDFTSFEDANFGLVRNAWRLLHRYGWYKGDTFSAWAKKQIAALGGDAELTFKTLAARANETPEKYRELYMIGTDLSAQKAVVYSAEQTPDTPIWEALRISMSLPLLFASVTENHDVWVDGGLSWNYPIDLFDRARYMPGVSGESEAPLYNPATLGFRVDSRAEIEAERTHFGLAPTKVDDLVSYLKALVGFAIDMANHAHLKETDWHRTVFIDSLGVSTTDFGIDEKQRLALIASGQRGAENYLEWFDTAPDDDPPLNRS
ncbi:MAG: patatin-like phospholipase family protein [Gammaproteobacteria bacterium]